MCETAESTTCDVEVLRAQCLQLQCELQDMRASRDAYMSKLKQKTADLRERERTVAEKEQRVSELQDELRRGSERNQHLEGIVRQYIDERQVQDEEARDLPGAESEDLKAELDRKKEDILDLRETIANMQARDIAAAAGLTESDQLAQMQKENIRLVEIIMQLKRREAESMNDDNEKEEVMTPRRSKSAKSRPQSGSFSPRKRTQEGLGAIKGAVSGILKGARK